MVQTVLALQEKLQAAPASQVLGPGNPWESVAGREFLLTLRGMTRQQAEAATRRWYATHKEMEPNPEAVKSWLKASRDMKDLFEAAGNFLAKVMYQLNISEFLKIYAIYLRGEMPKGYEPKISKGQETFFYMWDLAKTAFHRKIKKTSRRYLKKWDVGCKSFQYYIDAF